MTDPEFLTTWRERLAYAQLLSGRAMDLAESGDIVTATALLTDANRLRMAALEEKWTGEGRFFHFPPS